MGGVIATPGLALTTTTEGGTLSPRILRALALVRSDMQAHPRAFTSKTAVAYFRRYYDIRRYVTEEAPF